MKSSSIASEKIWDIYSNLCEQHNCEKYSNEAEVWHIKSIELFLDSQDTRLATIEECILALALIIETSSKVKCYQSIAQKFMK